MTKQQIAARVSKQTGLPALKVANVIQQTLESISSALADGEHIELRNFGVFATRLQKARVGRNPNTGAAVPVPARAVVRFKPGKELRRLVADRATSALLARQQPQPPRPAA
jgi:nucleoid DNA-binding protein